MKKLNVAIIGQGRSGRNIHGSFFKSEANVYFNVVAVVDFSEVRRERALTEYPGCVAYADYTELYKRDDIDLIVNASYSEMHYPITLDLLRHGRNVVVEKPMGRNVTECETLIKTAKDMGVTLAVFQQSLFTPNFLKVKEIIASGKIGDVEQISIHYNSLSRRWDWQTLQCRLAGSVYNTGPHPIGHALDLLGWDDQAKVVYSRLGNHLTSGDADDYAKILITAPGKPLVDIELSAIDAYNDFLFKVQGSRGTLKVKGNDYWVKYVVDGENEPRPVQYNYIYVDDHMPVYCSEKLITHEEEGTIVGDAFDAAPCKFYKMVYDKLTVGTPLVIKPENIVKVVAVIDKVHIDNPLPLKYLPEDFQ